MQFSEAYHLHSKEPDKEEEVEGEQRMSSPLGVHSSLNPDEFSHPKASYLEDATSHWGCRVARYGRGGWRGGGGGEGVRGEGEGRE